MLDTHEPSTTLEGAAKRVADFGNSGTGKLAALPGGAGIAVAGDMLGFTGGERDM
ncbi:hypothetical protein [Streptomyces sp. YGL11-2]|uniref:hypothetical protein n=1 Tax=Streptomyces sp. YGL11-2 TaxID=3414028 RepID=UPI003CEC489F